MKVVIEKEQFSDSEKWVIGIQLNERMNYLCPMSKEELELLSDAISKFLNSNDQKL